MFVYVYVYVCVRVCVTLTASKSFELILIKKKKKLCRVGFWLQAINIWIRCSKVFKANLMLYWSKIDKNFQ